MKKSSINLLASTIFLLATLGGFFWLWTLFSAKPIITQSASAETLGQYDIEGIKNQASEIVKDLKNVSGIPLTNNTALQGKVNPFE